MPSLGTCELRSSERAVWNSATGTLKATACQSAVQMTARMRSLPIHHFSPVR